MNVSTQHDFEYLVKRVFDDLVDECTLKEKNLRNGSRVAAKSLIKDALRMKIEFLEDGFDRTSHIGLDDQIQGDHIGMLDKIAIGQALLPLLRQGS